MKNSFVNTARRGMVAAMVGGALVMALPGNALAYSSSSVPVVTGATCTVNNSNSATVAWTWSTSAGKPTEARIIDPSTTNVLVLVQRFSHTELTTGAMSKSVTGNQGGKTLNVVMKNKSGNSTAYAVTCAAQS